MNFQFKAAAKKAPVKATAFQQALAEEETEKSPEVAHGKRIDYLQLKVLMEAKAVTTSVPENEKVEMEEKSKEERDAILKRREELLGIRSSAEPRPASSSTVDLKQAGLVMVTAPKSVSERGEAKHIQRMVETAQVNEKFKNLLKMKVADRDKDKAEAEFGERPQEFVTSAYLKQKEESLRLERELQASESQKRDMSNLFREMLGSGQYARTKFETTSQKTASEVTVAAVPTASPSAPPEPSEALVKKVLEKVVAEDAKEVTKAIHEKARQEAFRIVDQIEQLVEHDEEESREEARLSAKERYLQRKRQRLMQDNP